MADTDEGSPASLDGAPLLGVCYYPEHWPEAWWREDAARMRDMGIGVVRIGEFAWSRIEPRRGEFDWSWLDRAVATLAEAGLRIVLGTPTACPPKWLVDELPDILPADRHGRPRRFGSRRHYCFSSPAYRQEARRIVAAMAGRYGDHPAVVAWQTDNEFGCHDTVESYSRAAADGFRRWLRARYRDVAALNDAWGTVFWSQRYDDFDQVDPPAATVTEANPAHRLDFRRYSSDQVVAFNAEQVAILREASPGRPITHNFMGLFTDFDHFAVARELDAASWDSYPLGFLEQGPYGRRDRAAYRRQGHPDFAGFHHDLYRRVGRGRLWVMEQQPGPVNWAAHNAAPLPGMVRLWLWEAIAHGAELTSIFRWRRAPFGQEQMHAALLGADGADDRAAGELRQVRDELTRLPPMPASQPARVALAFDYEACWVTDIQPQSSGFSALSAALSYYGALRRAGLDVDVVAPGDDVSDYALVVLPCLPVLSRNWADHLDARSGALLMGARTGSKTADFQVPAGGEPGPVADLLPVRVARVDSLGADTVLSVSGVGGQVHTWLEEIDSPLEPRACADDGRGVWFCRDGRHYLPGCPSDELLDAVVAAAAGDAGLPIQPMPAGVRQRRRGGLTFVFNYASEVRPLPVTGRMLIGGAELGPADVAVLAGA